MSLVPGRSVFDAWSIAHLGFWIFVGSSFWPFLRSTGSRLVALIAFFALAILWEVFERYAEKKWPQIWLHPEAWYNSYIGDLITVIIGVLGIWYLLDKTSYLSE